MAEYNLTDDQKKWVDLNGEKVGWDLLTITRSITGENKDGRSLEGKAVKKYILEKHNAAPSVRTMDSETYQAFELDEDQKDFVFANARDMTLYEMTTLLFPDMSEEDPKKVFFSKESRAIERTIRENFGDSFFEQKGGSLGGSKFKPPKDGAAAISLICKYIGQDIKWSKLKDHEKDSIEKLVKNLKRASFSKTFEQFRTNNEREIFLENFIADTWDKNNLTPGEVSAYIDLAGERVNLYQIKEYQQGLQKELDEDLTSQDGKLRYTLIDAIDKQIQNKDKCMNRISKLQNDLEGSRTKRLEKEGGNEITILSLCEELAKEKSRKKVAKVLEKERNKVKKSIDEIEEMSDYTARLFGASREELLN